MTKLRALSLTSGGYTRPFLRMSAKKLSLAQYMDLVRQPASSLNSRFTAAPQAT